MKTNPLLVGFLSLMTALGCLQQPIAAKNKDSSSSSEQYHKLEKCCKETTALLNQINQTTQNDLVVDTNTLGIVRQINQTTLEDLAIDQTILGLANDINDTTLADLAIDQEILDIVNDINDTTLADLAIDQEILDIVAPLAGCVQYITELPYEITTPGYYKLNCDLVFAPDYSVFAPPHQQAVQAAITVRSSDVVVDLNGYHLSQFVPANPSEQVPFCIGILVPDPLPTDADINAVGLESVYILGNHGVISDFSMYGVRVFAHTSDITISNLTIKDTAKLASLALRPTVYGQPYLPHDQITPAFGPSFGVAGLAIGESVGYGMGPEFFNDVSTTQLNVVNRTKNVRLSNVSCLNNFLFGATITLSTNVTIDNCHFDYNWSDDPGSSITPVYSAIGPRGLTFTDSQSNGASPNGNSDPNNVNVFVSNSTFNNTAIKGDYATPLISLLQTTAPGGNSGFITLGCADTRSQKVTFSNCQFNSSSCTFPNALGLNFGNYSWVTSVVCGYAAGGIEDTTFMNCSSDGHFNLGNINGYHISGNTINEPIKSARNINFIGCTANNLQSRSDLILPASPINTRTIQGWSISFAKDVYCQDCQADDFYIAGPSPITGSTSAGFAPASNSNNASTQVENWTFKNCTSSRIRQLNGGTCWGFNTFIPNPNTAKSLLFDDCKSTGHQTLLSSVYAAWSSTTTYSVGALVSFSGVNYVSLASSNLNFAPNTNPAKWSPVNSSPAAWVSTTSYNLGALVSFTDATGHTNEYISTINSNLGKLPNASGPGGGSLPQNWVQTNWYPTWNSTATYLNGSIVGYNGVNYIVVPTSNVKGTQTLTVAPFTLTVVSTAGFPSSGTLQVATTASSPQLITYTGITATTFTGCVAAGSFTTNDGSEVRIASRVNGTQALSVAPFTLNVSSTSGFASSGILLVPTTSQSPQFVSYTGTTATSFTGCVATGSFTTNNNSIIITAYSKGDVPTGAPWGVSTSITQLSAGGFFSQQNQVGGVGGPELYKNCVATQNIGAPGPVIQAGLNRYSAGFATVNALGTIYDSCIAADNIYGFMLANSTKCVVKNCQAHNNFVVASSGGIQTVSVASGGTGYTVGDVLTVTGGNGKATVVVNAVAAGVITSVSSTNPGANYSAAVGVATTGGTGTGATITITAVAVGEGFTDLGATGSAASPTQSSSLFLGNTAFNNGPTAQGAFAGPNCNYNLWVNSGLSVRPPLLRWSYSAGTQTPTDPATYNAGLHNISSILN